MYLVVLCIIASHASRAGLLSRTKVGHEYVPPPDSIILPSDWRQETYEDIADMNEIRDLTTRRVVSDTRAPQRTRTAADASEEYFDTLQPVVTTDPDEREDTKSTERQTAGKLSDKVTNSSWSLWRSSTASNDLVTTSASGDNETSSSLHEMINGSARFMPDPTKSGRRWLLDWFGPFGTKTGICYTCGLKYLDIPVTPYCYAAFQSDDWRMRTFARYSRCECYRSLINYTRQKTYYYSWWNYRTTDKGLMTQYFNRKFIEGCFKRWTDIGTVYYQRGCRRYLPWTNSQTFADYRFARLEVMLRRLKKGCIASTHASLIPFARGISLYTRFHVCVCSSKYCNGAPPAHALSPYTLICALLYILTDYRLL